jgi:hypothetical protein
VAVYGANLFYRTSSFSPGTRFTKICLRQNDHKHFLVAPNFSFKRQNQSTAMLNTTRGSLSL